jgi:rhamnulokinase
LNVLAAVDLGASGGRVMRAVVDGDRIQLDAVHRFPNGVVDLDGHLRWRFTELATEVSAGLAMIPDAESIGIDTWAVDYGLLDDDGRLLAEPISYRDDRTAKAVETVHAAIAPEALYAVNGLQFLPFNTLYQLAAEPALAQARHAVLIPDLLAFWLTGNLGSELTNASTTGLLDVRTLDWSAALFDRIGLPTGLLPPLERPGTVRGTTAEGVPVITVGSHDTASAVAGVPATTDRFAYIASGTWSLVGLELPAPVLTEAARTANFTNEVGVEGRTRFLRNVGGLWLLQESMRTWGRSDLGELLAAAADVPSGGRTFDVDDPSFIAPDGMPARIAAAAGGPGMSPPQLVRCILDSLASAYARTIRSAADLAMRTVDVVHVVGGGSQNGLLCQLTADAVGLPVLAGPMEATTLGNVVVQAAAAGLLPSSLDEVRVRLAHQMTLRRYDPS